MNASDPLAPALAGAEPQLVSSQRWQHRFGSMLIETYSDGSVRVDGKVVADTLPPAEPPPTPLPPAR